MLTPMRTAVAGLVALCVLVSGCLFVVNRHPDVVLAGNNFKVVKSDIVGTSRGLVLLGFIPVLEPTRIKALSRVHSWAGLQKGRPQTLANLVEERSQLNLLLFQVPEISIRADVVEFTGPPPEKIIFPKGLSKPGESQPYIMHRFPREPDIQPTRDEQGAEQEKRDGAPQ